MYVLIFFAWFVWNVSQFRNDGTRYYHKCTYIFSYSTCFSCQILIEFHSSGQILKKVSKILIFQENFFWWEPSCFMRTDRRVDGQAEVTELIVGFRNFANAHKNYTSLSHCIYVFCIDLRKNCDYFAIQHYLTGFITEMNCVYCAVRAVFLNII